jgi:hypothetical protein
VGILLGQIIVLIFVLTVFRSAVKAIEEDNENFFLFKIFRFFGIK